jgi:hypothetical protein
MSIAGGVTFFVLLAIFPAIAALEHEEAGCREGAYDDYDELLKRDKLSLDLFWIKDKSLTDTDALPAPDIIAAEISDDLEAALEQFTKIAARLGQAAGVGG